MAAPNKIISNVQRMNMLHMAPDSALRPVFNKIILVRESKKIAEMKSRTDINRQLYVSSQDHRHDRDQVEHPL